MDEWSSGKGTIIAHKTNMYRQLKMEKPERKKNKY